MPDLRIALVGVSVEALIGSPLKTDCSAMQTYRGGEITNGNLWLVRGVLDRLGQEADLVPVPLLWATALPGGALTFDNYDAIKRETVTLLKAHGPFDGTRISSRPSELPSA